MDARRQIDLSPKARKEIKEAFKCSSVAMWRALSFQLNTPLSLRIRKLAMEKGGIVMMLLPETETIHDHDGYMRQYFGNGTMLEADKRTGTVQVFGKDGNVLKTVNNCTVSYLENVQAFAEGL